MLPPIEIHGQKISWREDWDEDRKAFLVCPKVEINGKRWIFPEYHDGSQADREASFLASVNAIFRRIERELGVKHDRSDTHKDIRDYFASLPSQRSSEQTTKQNILSRNI